MSGERSPDSRRTGERGAQHLDDDLIFKFMNGLVDAKEKQTIYEHLGLCHDCAHEVAAIAKFALHGPAPEEEAELQKLLAVNVEAELAQVMAKTEAFFPKQVSETKINKPQSLPVGRRVQQWWTSLFPLPRYAALALSVVVVGFFIYDKVFQNSFAGYYVYDNKLPYEYNVSSLRSASPDWASDSLLQAFVRQFKFGMSDYVIYDYANAIRLLQNLEPAVIMLQTRADDITILPWLRDYYFYRGVTHFALSRSRQLELRDEVKVQQANQSIRWLALADSLVTVRHLENSDRETYFLGLAYGFGDQHDSAIVQLHQIKPESRFYDDSVKLIHEWSNE